MDQWFIRHPRLYSVLSTFMPRQCFSHVNAWSKAYKYQVELLASVCLRRQWKSMPSGGKVMLCYYKHCICASMSALPFPMPCFWGSPDPPDPQATFGGGTLGLGCSKRLFGMHRTFCLAEMRKRWLLGELVTEGTIKFQKKIATSSLLLLPSFILFYCVSLLYLIYKIFTLPFLLQKLRAAENT